MESYGNVFDEEWVNLGSMFFCDQDSSHVTGHGLFLNEHDHGLNLEAPVLFSSANDSISSSSGTMDDQILAYASDHDIRSHFCNYFSQESSNIMEGDSSNFMFLAQVFSDDAMEEINRLKQDVVVEMGKMDNSVSLKRKYEVLEHPTAYEEHNTTKIDKKKTRVSNDHNKNKKNSPPKKNQKMMTSVDRNEDDDEVMTRPKNEKFTNKNNRRGNVQSSSSCSSEDDSNIVIEKTRAGRGAATDPQSIYARKRRERINERLRILQTLVPNGTKVDISTMLEEAVHYVKFLQLQINLLSSDDKWMYAPIAYNGVDMGLYKTL